MIPFAMIVDREFLERHPQVPLAERDDAPKMLPMSRNNPLTMSPEWTPGGRLVHVARRYRRRSRCGTGRRRASVSGRTSTGQGQPARDGDRDSGEHAAWSRIENRLEPADSRRALNYDGRTDEGSGLPKRKSASRPTSICRVNPSLFSTSPIERIGGVGSVRPVVARHRDNRGDISEVLNDPSVQSGGALG
jgi:hypothetical protein